MWYSSTSSGSTTTAQLIQYTRYNFVLASTIVVIVPRSSVMVLDALVPMQPDALLVLVVLAGTCIAVLAASMVLLAVAFVRLNGSNKVALVPVLVPVQY